MYLESMDPGLDCLNPDFRTGLTKFCDPIPSPDPGNTEPVRQDKLPDTKADPMKDTGGAVVTLVTCIFQNQQFNTGTDGKGSLNYLHNIT